MPRLGKQKKTTQKKTVGNGQFQLLDKVFAPLQDYPFWPAKITKLYGEERKLKNLKGKCEVFYYGRRETGTCSLDQLQSYLAYKKELPSQLPTSKVAAKLLKLAMDEIENDDTDIAPRTVKRKRKHVESARNNANESGNDGDISQDEEESQDEQEPASLAGDEEEQDSSPKLKKTKSTLPSIGKRDDPDKSSASVNDKTHPAGDSDNSDIPTPDSLSPNKSDGAAASPTQEGVETNIDSTESAVPLETLPAHLMPTNMGDVQNRINEYEALKKIIEKGGVIPVPYVTPDPNAMPGSSVYSTQPRSNMPPLVCEDIRVEFKMMTLRSMVIKQLTEGQVNIPRAMAHLDGFFTLNITKDMLLRNMEVIDMVRRLQKFSIRTNNSTEYKDELDLCVAQIQASHIRNYADRMLDKFSALFTIPRGKTFYDVYSLEYQAEMQRNVAN